MTPQLGNWSHLAVAQACWPTQLRAVIYGGEA
jgi:hypothetical protein